MLRSYRKVELGDHLLTLSATFFWLFPVGEVSQLVWLNHLSDNC